MNQITVDGFVNSFKSGTTRSGDSWCRFSLSNQTYGGKDDDGNSTYNKHWFNVSVFGGLADQCIRYLDAGDEPRLVTVVGQMEQQEWTDDEGNTRKNYDIRAREVTRGGSISSFGTAAPVQREAVASPAF